MLQTLNRNIAPDIESIKNLDIRKPKESTLSNEISVFSFDVSDQDFVRIELNFDAGSSYSNKSLVASVANKLLVEGSNNHTAAEIANLIDSYGAFFETSITNDVASVALITLNKYLDKTLPLLAEVVKAPSFDKDEFDLHIAQKRNEFLVNIERTNYIARINFPSILFGKEHSYGRLLELESFNQVNLDDINKFHNDFYLNGNRRIFITGKLMDNTIPLINQFFGDMNQNREVKRPNVKMPSSSNDKVHLIEKENAVQNALRIGNLTIDKQHSDFNSLRILNTILGGYFGSRLMTNIREDKGYTYGIGSGLMSLDRGSFFFITSEVKSEVSEKAISEIIHEIERLQTVNVGDDELDLVKNYLQGNFQRSFDGPFALLDRFKEVYLGQLDYSYYTSYIEKVKSISSDELIRVANDYLKIEDLYKLTVGKIN